jgi:hypothetical protein
MRSNVEVYGAPQRCLSLKRAVGRASRHRKLEASDNNAVLGDFWETYITGDG